MVTMFAFSVILRNLLLTLLSTWMVRSQIKTNSIDYWIGNISPRCAINLIYHNFTTNLRFSSAHEIPIMLIPLKHIPDSSARYYYLRDHQFFNSSLIFMKAECYFSIIYYKPPKNYNNTAEEGPRILIAWISAISYGFPYWSKYTSNVTYCLLLHHGVGNESKKRRLITVLTTEREYSLALIYLSSNSTGGYTVYCKTPYRTFKAAAKIVANETTSSIINPNFIDSCSNNYPFVAVAEQYYASSNYDPIRLVSEHEVISCVLAKLNASLATREIFYEERIPLVAIKDSPKHL